MKEQTNLQIFEEWKKVAQKDWGRIKRNKVSKGFSHSTGLAFEEDPRPS